MGFNSAFKGLKLLYHPAYSYLLISMLVSYIFICSRITKYIYMHMYLSVSYITFPIDIAIYNVRTLLTNTLHF